jgi:hypothetical protein
MQRYSSNPLTIEEMEIIREALRRLAPHAPPKSDLESEVKTALYALTDAIERIAE